MNKRVKELVVSATLLSSLSIPMYAKIDKVHNNENKEEIHEFLLAGPAYPGEIIQKGSKGENVKKIQQRLNDLGFNAGSVDGDFGGGTDAAVRAFQSSRGLDADGQVGPSTWAALFDTPPVPPNPGQNQGSAYPGSVIKRGSKDNNNVKKIQQRLNELGFSVGAVDGDFGGGTESAVKRFQESRGLDADGQVGPATWKALFDGSTPNPDHPTNKGQAIVNEARKHLGKSYVYGATGPNTFDCSGLTQYVYKHALGIDITRTTYTQINQGRAVSRNDLQPGDLVFPNAGHVGIYIGNGQIIHAPKTGDVVKISNIWAFYAGRRII